MSGGEEALRPMLLAALLGTGLLTALAGPLGAVATASADSHYTPRDPIVIEGNANFTTENGVVGGSGTPADPYVIEGWEIDASQALPPPEDPDQAAGVRIHNTDAHFVVRDVRVHSGGLTHHGAFFDSVVNGSVEDSMLTGNGDGIRAWYSSRLALANNTISDNRFNGVDLTASVDVTVTGNTLSSNGWYGIHLLHTTEVVLEGNEMVADGIFMNGNAPVHFSSHTIPSSNLVGGKPVYYYKDCGDLEIDGIPVGQVLVVNCTGVTIANLEIVDGDTGILLAFVDGASIANNTIRGHYWDAISLAQSTNVVASDNTLSENYVGVDINLSTGVELARNNLWVNDFGVYLYESGEVLVHDNRFIGNEVQGFDTGGAENSWNRGYPSGGNYWSDYDGEDRCSGPDQDVCPDPDGLGDTPYVLDADSKDAYPLFIANTPPSASFSVSPRIGVPGEAFVVDASSSSDGQDPLVALEVRWDWDDDGSWDTPYSRTKIQEHTYPSPGAYTIRLEVRDQGGLTNQTTRQAALDAEPPLTQAILSGTDGLRGWFTSSVTVNLSPVDDASGVAFTSYRVDGGEWIAYSAPFDVTGEGSHAVEFFSMDEAGREEPVRNVTLRIDTILPTLLVAGLEEGQHVTLPSLAVSWEASDATSGVDHVELILDDGPTTDLGAAGSTTLTDLHDGEHLLTLTAVDEAGNRASMTLSFRVDTNPLSPTGPYGPWLLGTVLATVATVVALGFLWRRLQKARPLRRKPEEKTP